MTVPTTVPEVEATQSPAGFGMSFVAPENKSESNMDVTGRTQARQAYN